MTIGEKIALLRKSKGMTQANLAEQLLFSRQAIQKWETGQTNPDVYTVPKLAEIFNISVDSLLSDTITENELISESLGLSIQTKDTSNSNTTFNSVNSIMWMPVIAIILGFMGIGFIMIIMFFIFGLLSPLVDLGILGLAIYELIIRINEGLGVILLASAVIILSMALFYPSILLMKLILKEYKKIWYYVVSKSKLFIKKLFNK